MALQRYGFIVKSNDLEMFKHHARLNSENFSMMVSGVSDVAQAEMVAQEMITKDVQLIELCGAFSAEDAQQIRDAINDHIPVGYVQYTDDERARLKSELS
ncbi:DUF6506 family protein [Neptunomonas japonica]|uniref:Uncharacterized protein n=1 Tax=Neptunomonas japonica JAMM 1380 TaxID=1441457 RepID=A0A7R6SVE5_9GAMM|nr:DUF6506 family protein [Neptunomonas japonica]BBB29474.1 conserved hypothetical protein [Neptunomonas japonica JAMM 1380]